MRSNSFEVAPLKWNISCLYRDWSKFSTHFRFLIFFLFFFCFLLPFRLSLIYLSAMHTLIFKRFASIETKWSWSAKIKARSSSQPNWIKFQFSKRANLNIALNWNAWPNKYGLVDCLIETMANLNWIKRATMSLRNNRISPVHSLIYRHCRWH